MDASASAKKNQTKGATAGFGQPHLAMDAMNYFDFGRKGSSIC